MGTSKSKKSTSSKNTILEDKTYQHSDPKSPILHAEYTLYQTISASLGNDIFSIPTPLLSPQERQRQRLARRNERNLYRRTCDATGEQIISVYTPKGPYKVYNQEYRRSDQRDALQYGQLYTPGISIFNQLEELILNVPHPNLFSTNCQNCDYTNYTINSTNCYSVFGSSNSNDSLFGQYIFTCNSVCDSIAVSNSQDCYEGISSEQCTRCQYFKNSHACTDCFAIEYCRGCNDCIGCIGLQNKEYHIFNKQVTKKTFTAFWELLASAQKRKETLQIMHTLALPENVPTTTIINSKNTSGDMLINCQDCLFCYDCSNCTHCMYTANAPHTSRSCDIDYTAPAGTQYGYNLCTCCGTSKAIGCMQSRYCESVFYCLECQYCNHCFGCVGLRNKEYCILNKQYTPKDYQETIAHIVQAMKDEGTRGQFLPQQLSPFAYNETLAHEYYPATQHELEKLGYKRESIDTTHAPVTTHLHASELPDTIHDVNNDILTTAILCKETGRPFRVLKQELDFYRNMNIPLPDLHPDIRHTHRMSKRNRRDTGHST